VTPPRGRSDLTGRQRDVVGPTRRGPRLPDSLPVIPTGLTRQQARVIAAFTRHDTRKEAAAELGLSVYTVRHHLNLAYARLGVSSIVGAIRVLGWFQVPDEDEILAMCDADSAVNRLRVAIDDARSLLDRLDERPS
jgi:DNA-binding CsgD family transcriptional regulator